MALTPANFVALFPEFTAQPLTRVQLFLDKATRSSDPVKWGTLYEDAMNLLAAHMLCKSAQGGRVAGGSAGPTTMETVGNLSRQYASTHQLGYRWTDYATTPYGQEYLDLCCILGPTPAVTG